MTSILTELMQKYYLTDHGTVNVRMVLNELREKGNNLTQLFADLVDDPTQQRWQLSQLKGCELWWLKANAVLLRPEYYFVRQIILLQFISAEEFMKTINSLAASQKSAPILIEFIRAHLEKPTEEDRWLAFYAAGMLVENRKKAFIPMDICEALRKAANAEPENKRRQEYLDLVGRIKNETHEDVRQSANIFKRYDLDTEKAGKAKTVSADPALQKIAQFVVDGDADGILEAVKDVLKSKSPLEVINDSLIAGMNGVSRLWDEGVYFTRSSCIQMP